jgi:hypothetical protein
MPSGHQALRGGASWARSGCRSDGGWREDRLDDLACLSHPGGGSLRVVPIGCADCAGAPSDTAVGADSAADRNADPGARRVPILSCARTNLSGVGLTETVRAAADISFKLPFCCLSARSVSDLDRPLCHHLPMTSESVTPMHHPVIMGSSVASAQWRPRLARQLSPPWAGAMTWTTCGSTFLMAAGASASVPGNGHRRGTRAGQQPGCPPARIRRQAG